MSQVHIVKDGLCAALGTLGALIAAMFGGWSGSLTTLCICMAIDYIMGIIVAGVFHRSGKSADGTLESRAGWKGIVKKFVTLLVVLVAGRLDIQLGTSIIREAVIIAFISNEVLSITENAGLMGIPMPEIIKSAIHVLKNQADMGTDAVEKMRRKSEDEPPDGEGDAE